MSHLGVNMFHNSLHRQSRCAGFTLLEVLITASIASILIASAVPNFVSMTKNSRLSTSVNEFAASLYLARSESLKRGQRVVMCKSAGGADCTNDGSWEQGWIIFEDRDNSMTVNAGEAILKINAAMPNGIRTTSGALIENQISYLATGAVATQSGGIQSGTIQFCDNRTGDAAKGVRRDLVLFGSGRFRIDTGADC